MGVERSWYSSFRFLVAADTFSTKWSDVEETFFGRHVIQPRGGKLVEIKTPQGPILLVREKDIIHLRGPQGKGNVTTTFTALNLPEGYKIVQPMKGDSIDEL